jgi:hypothetical protein
MYAVNTAANGKFTATNPFIPFTLASYDIYYSNARLANARIYNIALSSAEVAALYKLEQFIEKYPEILPEINGILVLKEENNLQPAMYFARVTLASGNVSTYKFIKE